MKNNKLKIILLAVSLVFLNLPFFLLAKRNYISQEQPDFSATFEDRLDIADKDFTPKKQLVTASRDGLTGFSFLLYNSYLSEKQVLKLEIYEPDDLESPLLSQNFSFWPNFLFSSTTLTFDSLPNSQNQSYIVVISRKGTSKKIIRQILSKSDYTLNTRPLYSTKNILADIRYRTAQYKPVLLKNPALPIFYIAFNIIFVFLMLEILKLKKKK